MGSSDLDAHTFGSPGALGNQLSCSLPFKANRSIVGPACWWLTVFRLSAAGRRFALTSFAVKVAIFWIAQLGVCVLDPRRMVCGVVERGFLPCLISFAVMDFVVIPQLRRRWDRQAR